MYKLFSHFCTCGAPCEIQFGKSPFGHEFQFWHGARKMLVQSFRPDQTAQSQALNLLALLNVALAREYGDGCRIPFKDLS